MAAMAYDEQLANRVRSAIPPGVRAVEQTMFGGLAFMLGGHMFCGVVADELMVRLGREGTALALPGKGVRPMDFTGRVMTTMVMVGPDGLRGRALPTWVDRGIRYVASLPPKPQGASRVRKVAG